MKTKILITANERRYELFHWSICSQCLHLDILCCGIVLCKHSASFLLMICSIVLRIVSWLSSNSYSCNNCWTYVNDLYTSRSFFLAGYLISVLCFSLLQMISSFFSVYTWPLNFRPSLFCNLLCFFLRQQVTSIRHATHLHCVAHLSPRIVVLRQDETNSTSWVAKP